MKEGEAQLSTYFLLSRTRGATSQSFKHNLFSSHEPNAGMLYDLAFRHQQDLMDCLHLQWRAARGNWDQHLIRFILCLSSFQGMERYATAYPKASQQKREALSPPHKGNSSEN